MKAIKVTLLILVILAGAWLVLCLMGPKTFDTERSIAINAPSEVIYPIVNEFEQWAQWSPWEKQDPQMQKQLSGPAAGVGATMAWQSEVSGNGSMKIIEAEPFRRLVTELRFEGFDEPSQSAFIFEADAGKTKLTWTMEAGEVPFIFRGFMAIMNPVASINRDYDEGLGAIKSLAESRYEEQQLVVPPVDEDGLNDDDDQEVLLD